MAKIYIATSWKNNYYPNLRHKLLDQGHEVYDFRDPEFAFKWENVKVPEGFEDWYSHSERFTKILASSWECDRGFNRDKEALDWCDTCILLLPCGRSAHLEAGYIVGQGKRLIIYLSPNNFEPELMYKFTKEIVNNELELEQALNGDGK